MWWKNPSFNGCKVMDFYLKIKAGTADNHSYRKETNTDNQADRVRTLNVL